MCLIQINNLRVFFKFRLLSWSLFNLQMYTVIHMYTFKPFPMYFIWNNSQLLCLVNNNVGTCTYIVDRRLPTNLTPFFGNHLFANYHVLKHPLANLILSSFYIPKVVKSAAKNLEIGSQIKNNDQN